METVFKTVPWFNTKEWKNVLELLFSPESNMFTKKQALQILLVWKARCPILPSGIESTLGLLEVELNSCDEKKLTDRVARLMYSSALMRFINHSLDDAPFKGLTLLQAAQTMNIPEWIVNLRHEAAHGHELPSLSILKNAAIYAMNWLFESYWIPQNNILENYITKQYSSNSFEQDLSDLINNYILLAIFATNRFNIKIFGDIPDEDIKNSLFDFVSERIIKSRVGTHWDMKLKILTHKVLKEIDNALTNSKYQYNKELSVARILIDPECLFLASEFDISENESSKNGNDCFPDWFVSAFDSLLTIIHKRSMLNALISELFQLSNNDKEDHQRRLRAALWIKLISLGLRKSKLFAPLADKLQCNEEKKNKNKEKESQILLLIHHHPNQKFGLYLDLVSPVPKIFSNKKFIYENLRIPNEYIKIYIKEFLALSDATLSSSSIAEVLELVDIISQSGNSQTEIVDEKIYTLTDLANACGDIPIGNTICDKISNANESSDQIFVSSRWEKASSKFSWKTCPLGVLPWQLNEPGNPTFW